MSKAPTAALPVAPGVVQTTHQNLPTKTLLASFAAAFLSVASAPAPAEAATCGLGYLERLDRKGDSYCVSASRERTRLLKRQQAMRAYQEQWRAELERDRQLLRKRNQLAKQNTF